MKKIFVIIVVVVVVGVLGYGFLKGWFTKSGTEGEGSRTGDLPDVGGLPAIETPPNPLENVPDINPVEKTNPFTDIKTNPFE